VGRPTLEAHRWIQCLRRLLGLVGIDLDDARTVLEEALDGGRHQGSRQTAALADGMQTPENERVLEEFLDRR